jgi:acyl carrier protein
MDVEDHMNTSEIQDALRDILISQLYVECKKEDIRSDSSLRTDLGVDSLGFVELKEQMQIEFGISISDAEFTPDNFATIDSLTALISNRIGGS